MFTQRSLAAAVSVIALSLFVLSQPAMAAKPPIINDSYDVQMLFVQNAKSGSFDGAKLILNGISPTVYFSDRPYRIAGSIKTSGFVDIWHEGDKSFEVDPPNAALSLLDEGQEVTVIVELKNPTVQGDSIVYDAQVLNGQLPQQFGEASLFIDGSDAGWGAAGGLLGGLLLGKVLDSSSQNQPNYPPPPYYYGPPPAYYGYGPEYYQRPPAYPQAPPPPRQ